jgi:hypothetical protein
MTFPKITFKFDKEKEIKNFWEICNEKSLNYDFSAYLPPKVKEAIKGKSLKEAEKALEKYYKDAYASQIIEIFREAIAKAWKSIEKEYFRRLQKITGKKLSLKKATAYMTIAPRCPYDKKEKWFMVNAFGTIPAGLKTIGHELMHFHFFEHYWEDIEKQIGFEKTNDLKESLTVLLNLEFRDLWVKRDEGYPKHEELREFISSQWKDKKNFNLLLNKCVDYLKIKSK